MSFQERKSSTPFFGTNAPYVEELYEQYLEDAQSVPETWQKQFALMKSEQDRPHSTIIAAFEAYTRNPNMVQVAATGGIDSDTARKQVAVQQLVYAYRFIGAHNADLDPLKRQEKQSVSDLELATYGLSNADLETEFDVSNTFFGFKTAKLKDIIAALQQTYCKSVGIEFMHSTNSTEKRWWQTRLEGSKTQPKFSVEQKKRILERLTAAEGLERYLHTRYVGQKRFSLEGGESLIPCLDVLIQRSGSQGVKEVVMGMAHRGRLNVLINTLGKQPAELFDEFEGKKAYDLPAGDVKYHQGFSSDVETTGGVVHLSLAFNPSHLEIVNPVVEGSAFSRQQRRGDDSQKHTGREVLPILMHGDAAFAGQGVIMEGLNLSQTRSYGTGGTVHVVINNQIGFTTSDPRDARSTIYCTDVAKMMECPILHVNGDDAEAVAYVSELALDYRQEFGRDVVIDIVCFRKLGHNEQDTPALTQPLMYKAIAKHLGTRHLYGQKLVQENVCTDNTPDEMVGIYRDALDKGQHVVNPVVSNYKSEFAVNWTPFLNKEYTDESNTTVPLAELKAIGTKLTTYPDTFKPHNLVEKLLGDRRKMAAGDQLLDWGMGEHLAFATLLNQGYSIRISGQDCGRGTFTHRHAVLHDQNRERWDEGTYVPLKNVKENQPDFTVIDSVLSEEAVLAFEYGYACTDPNALVIWEGQFGDFANGAQVVIDQFIASGEVKWGRLSGLVMMLPHGYEGQGPEHSSARLERFLQLCADDNMQVCYPSSPAQIFHLLRRQMVREIRKPLIIMTPKSLLRNKEAVSSLDELANGTFQTVIDDVTNAITDKNAVKRVVLASGKVYYDLMTARKEKANAGEIALVRMEQLYPFPQKALKTILEQYPNATEVVWCQEEPQNQGAWLMVYHDVVATTSLPVRYAGRKASASPAVGHYSKHNEEQKALVEAALN